MLKGYSVQTQTNRTVNLWLSGGVHNQFNVAWSAWQPGYKARRSASSIQISVATPSECRNLSCVLRMVPAQKKKRRALPKLCRTTRREPSP